jgi:hypothetical protein
MFEGYEPLEFEYTNQEIYDTLDYEMNHHDGVITDPKAKDLCFKRQIRSAVLGLLTELKDEDYQTKLVEKWLGAVIELEATKDGSS